MNIQEAIQNLNTESRVELFELDLRPITGSALESDRIFFHAGTNGLTQSVVWQGKTYQPFPVEAEGFDKAARGALPRPRLRVANVTGIITPLLKDYQDLVGAKVVRRVTLVRFLDAVNFSSNPNVLARTEMLSDTSSWSRAQITTVTADATADPNGKMTADLIVPNTTTGFHYIVQNLSPVPADNSFYSASVYVKKGSTDRVLLYFYAKTGSSAALDFRFEGARMCRTYSTPNPSTATFAFDDVGNGWYRLKIGNVAMLTGATTPQFRLFPSRNPAVHDTANYTAVAATAAVSAQAPPSGTRIVSTLIETTASGTGHYVTGNRDFVAGQRYVAEVYAKELGSGSKRYLGILFAGSSAFTSAIGANFDLATGQVVNISQSATIKTSGEITSVGNGWYLCKLLATATGTGVAGLQIRLSNQTGSAGPSYTGDGVSGFYICEPWSYAEDPAYGMGGEGQGGGIFTGDGVGGFYAWGAQAEAGSVVTAYRGNGATVGANSEADPNQALPDDVFYVERKTHENRNVVEWELASAMDLEGVQLPARTINVNFCSWTYRGAECSYTGSNYFDVNNAPVGSLSLDVCSKTIGGCKARFGAKGLLPFGGFPAARAYKY